MSCSRQHKILNANDNKRNSTAVQTHCNNDTKQTALIYWGCFDCNKTYPTHLQSHRPTNLN